MRRRVVLAVGIATVVVGGAFAGWRVHEARSPEGVLRTAAERALKAGSAEIAVQVGQRWGEPLAGRANWSGAQESMVIPAMSRWRVTNRVYGPKPGTDPNDTLLVWAGTDSPDAYAVQHEQNQPVRVIIPFFLNALRAAGDVRLARQETVLGRAAGHYTTVVPFQSVKDLSTDIPWAAYMTEELTYGEQDENKHVSEIGIDAWVDGAGRLLRVREDLRTPRGMARSTTITIDFRSFGGVPPITPPKDARPVGW